MPLRSLLSHGLKKENGEITSKKTVKTRINQLVDKEDKASPLTDDKIRELLNLEGIIIQRRTVAKYRESLRILPTYLRRRKSLT
jgi:RNA polymerase sigma-54 factor